MKTKAMIMTIAAALLAQTAMPEIATAQRHSGQQDRYERSDRNWRGDKNDGWDPSRHYNAGKGKERRLGRNDRIYRGGDGKYYCKRNEGTTGLVVGALAGGLLGKAVGGNTLSALIGAGGGALLGKQVDRGEVKCR